MIALALRKANIYDAIQLQKEKIYYDSNDLFDNKIAYELFQGMKISNKVWWGRNDTLSKYLGQYEPQILMKLKDLSDKYDHFVDIGAADGYYAVGLLNANLYKTATCFEISSKGREVISENAFLNDKQDHIKIFGEANKETLQKEISKSGSCVVLCDIEGAEFDFFSKDVLKTLSQCEIIIELHDEFIAGEKDRRTNLINNARDFFEVSPISRTDPTPNKFDELSGWSDDTRQLAFSENRPCRMDWLHLTPLSKL